MPRIAIVGNAPLNRDYSDQVDACDLVIRMNGCTSWKSGSGDRIDILALCNSGADSAELLQQYADGEAFENAGEIWLIRDSEYYRQLLATALQYRFFDARIYTVDPGEWLRDAGNAGKKIRNLDKEAEIAVGAAIRILWPSRRWGMPSTGAVVVQHCLSKFPDAILLLVGFMFRGWMGHPWGGERLWMAQLASMGIVELMGSSTRRDIIRDFRNYRKRRGYPLDGDPRQF